MAASTKTTNRSVLLTTDIVPAFNYYECADPTHHDGLSWTSVKVADCISEKKYAIVNEVGDFYITHDDSIDEDPNPTV